MNSWQAGLAVDSYFEKHQLLCDELGPVIVCYGKGVWPKLALEVLARLKKFSRHILDNIDVVGLAVELQLNI
jgi:hypothetical protein